MREYEGRRLSAPWVFSVSGMCLISICCMANDVRELSLQERLTQADVVIVGTAGSKEGESDIEYTHVNVNFVLKGSPFTDILVLTRSSIAELQPNCCLFGHTYLFFLTATGNRRYEAVNGPFGIYELRADEQ